MGPKIAGLDWPHCIILIYTTIQKKVSFLFVKVICCQFNRYYPMVAFTTTYRSILSAFFLRQIH